MSFSTKVQKYIEEFDIFYTNRFVNIPIRDAVLEIENRIDDEILKLKNGDTSVLPVLFGFSKVPKKYFRSGYIKEKFF